jgi:hypothetical protein
MNVGFVDKPSDVGTIELGGSERVDNVFEADRCGLNVYGVYGYFVWRMKN